MVSGLLRRLVLLPSSLISVVAGHRNERRVRCVGLRLSRFINEAESRDNDIEE